MTAPKADKPKKLREHPVRTKVEDLTLPIVGMDEVRAFIAAHDWTFAKTMPQNPHWYVVRNKCRDEAEFVAVVLYIREHGRRVKYQKSWYTHLDVDGHHYWTMGDRINNTWILNRAINEAPKETPDGKDTDSDDDPNSCGTCGVSLNRCVCEDGDPR